MLRRSLATRLVLLLSLGIGAVLAALATLEYFSSREDILSRADRDTQNTIEDAAEKLENQLAIIEETTKLLAEILVQEEESEEELIEILRQAVDERSDIFGAAIALDPRWTSKPLQGFAPYFFYGEDNQLSYRSLVDSYDYTSRAWYRNPRDRGRPQWSEPYFDEGGGDIPMATFSAPMFTTIDGREEFYGVVTADITLETIQRRVNSIALGESGFAFLLSRSGRIISAPDPDKLLQPMLQILPVGENLPLWTRLINEAGEGNTVGSRMICHNQAGHCMLKLSPLSTTGWPLGVYYSEHEMLQPLRDYLTRLAGSTAVTLLLLSLIVTLVSRRITQPLGVLARATGKIAAGDFSTPMPPTRRSDEVGRLINAFATMQDNLRHYIRELREETATRNRIEGELDAAREIQMAMLPAGGRAMIEAGDFQLWARLQPARTVGGDLYNYYRQEDGSLLLAVGDVSDKGVPAALFMSRVMTLLQELDTSRHHIGEAMARLNNALARRNENCMFVTLFLGRFDPASRQLEYCSAGHPPPSLLRDGRSVSLEPDMGPALGLATNLEFPVNLVQLEPHDLLALYSDGIDETFNEDGEQFGIDRINQQMDLLDAAPLALAGTEILAAVDSYAGDRPQFDDIVLMLLRVNPLEFIHEIGHSSCGDALGWLRETTASHEVGDEQCRNALLMLEEALTNIEKYAGLEHGDRVYLNVEFTNRGMLLCLADPGTPFDPVRESQRAKLGDNADDAEIGGLGVHLLEAVSDWHSYHYQAGHNVLRLGIKS